MIVIIFLLIISIKKKMYNINEQKIAHKELRLQTSY